ncbi:MAG: hypothetical protein J6K16_03835, partial [Alphaproteobacteria bacterium]|nr:hypothetical protein [Alphaproteobacteria bacterium]
EDGKLTRLVRGSMDMSYKNGKEYDGHHISSKCYGDPRDGDIWYFEYTLKEGKYHGSYRDDEAGIYATYNMGVLHGKYSARLKDGSLKEGEYNRGEFVGTITSRDGLTVESWVDGKLELTTTYESAKINHWSGKVESHGRVTSEVRPNGECSEYRNGILVKKYEQKDGVKDGKYEEFDPNGWTRAEGQYKDGKLNGFYKEYNSDGTVASRRFYKDGKDMTPQREVMRKAAEEYVSSTEGVAPRRTKLQKAGVAIKMAIAGMKEGKS